MDANPRLERVIARMGTARGLAELIPLVEEERQRLLVRAAERERTLETNS